MKRSAQKPVSRRGQARLKNGTSRYDEKNERRAKRPDAPVVYGEVIPYKANVEPFKPKTVNQGLLVTTILAKTCTFAVGPAGTGKTYIALAIAAQLLRADPKMTLVCTNPATEIGEKLGTLPGDKDEKIAVSIRPMRDILHKLLGASHVENLVGAGRIVFEPLGSILGVTYDNAIVVLDEAQNTTPQQMKALLTRVGQNTKIILCGDYVGQLFIPGTSGLKDALVRLRDLDSVGYVEFTLDDVVRSGFCKEVLRAYQ